MKKILFFFLFFLLLLTGSCSDHRVQMVWLAEMNSLMEKNPQAAYDSLCNHRQDMSQCGEKVEMRYRMLEAKVLNLKSASNLNGNLNCSKELEHYAS